MDVIIIPLYNVISVLLNLYMWAIIISVVLSWLLAFGVINNHNTFVANIGHFFFKITEPALDPIRRMMPNLGGIDISPILLIIAIYFVQDVLHRLMFKFYG